MEFKGAEQIDEWAPFKKKPAFSSGNPDSLLKDKLDVPPNWKPKSFTEEDNPHGKLFDETKYDVYYPKYRETYIKFIFNDLVKILAAKHISVELHSLIHQISVRTTNKTFDPVMILRSRDLVQLLARSVPLEVAVRVLEDDVYSDIIEIGLASGSREKFLRRRSRLIGEDNTTLKALEAILNCYIMVQGKTVACIGGFAECAEVRKFVRDCVYNNIHPQYSLRILQIKRHLKTLPEMQNEDWSRFFPPINKSKVCKKKPKVIKKKTYELPSSDRTPRKEDIQMAQGIFHSKLKKQKLLKANKLKNRRSRE